jgi:hypothetical protein
MNWRSFLIIAILSVYGCERDDAAFSPGPGSYAQVSCVAFRVDYRACYGPGWSEGVTRKKANYDYYQISVEKAHATGTTVLFTKKFDVNEVKKSVLNRNAQDVVRIDGTTVTFLIQEKPYVVDVSKYMSSNPRFESDAVSSAPLPASGRAPQPER